MKATALPVACGRCGRRFMGPAAGLCSGCGLLLCARHFSLAERLKTVSKHNGPVCRSCRRQGKRWYRMILQEVAGNFIELLLLGALGLLIFVLRSWW